MILSGIRDESLRLAVDEAERLKARGADPEWLNRSLVVEAGAGTGKTRLLIERMTALIKTGLDLNRIAAITFTEKAAVEMAERLRLTLEQAAFASGNVIPWYWLQALGSLDTANVSTIHSFASNILRAIPFDLDLPPDFEVLEDDDEAELQRSALVAGLTGHNLHRDEILTEFAQLGGRLKDLPVLFKCLCENSDLSYTPSLNSEYLDKRVTDCRSSVGNLIQLARRECVDDSDLGRRQIERIAADVDSDKEADNYAILRILSRINQNHLGRGANWANSTSLNEFKTEMTRLKQSANETLDLARQLVFKRLLEWACQLVDALAENKRRLGQLSFQDLLLYARRALENETVRNELTDRWQRLLIDEFQDTDPLQVEIALYLTGVRSSQTSILSPGRILQDPGRIFIVGDPKQSIFRFRNADARMYKAAVNEVLTCGVKVSIVQNFRSAPGIIDFVNGLCGPLWAKYASEPTDWMPLAAGIEMNESTSSPSVLIAKPVEQIEADAAMSDLRRAEAGLIAEAIARIITREKWLVRDEKTPNGMRQARAGDIAILFPKMTEVELFTEALLEKDIPSYIEGGKRLLNRQIVQDIANCLVAIDNPLDDLAVFAALRSNIFGFPDFEIERWAILTGGILDYRKIPEQASSRLKEALTLLNDLHKLKQTLNAGQIIDILYERTQVLAALRSLGAEGEFDAEVLAHIAQLSYYKSVEAEFGLRRFRRSLAMWSESGDDPQKMPAADDRNLVRLMTIHSAKGLEFPIVILANSNDRWDRKTVNDLTDRLDGRLHLQIGAANSGFFTTEGFSEALKREKDLMTDERLHLLYVALTRARDHLIIPCVKANKPMGYAEWISEALDSSAEQGQNLRLLYREEMFPVSIERRSTPAESEAINVDVDAIWAEVDEWDIRRTEQLNRMADKQTRIISPSRHTDYENQVISDFIWAAVDVEKSARLGRAVHRYLALCSKQKELDIELLNSTAREERLGVDEMRNLILTALAGDVWQGVLASDACWREVPVTAATAEGMINGYIDVIWQSNAGDIFIADYKTGGEDIPNHRHQLQDYMKSVESIIKLKVKRGYVHYLRTDKIEIVE